MSKTIQRALNSEQLGIEARAYLVGLYGRPNDPGVDTDKWHERYGLLLGFIDELFTPPKP
jgi:hypothetical protein